MPRNPFQRSVFVLLTVLITVHAYVFYSLYVVNGGAFMALIGQPGVLAAIDAMSGVTMLGRAVPIWCMVLVEFALESVMGGPCSFKLACRMFDPRSTQPVLFKTAVICATVGLMCPAMSFVAACLYLSLLRRLQPPHPAGELSEAGVLQLSLRVLCPAVFHSAAGAHAV